MSPQQILTTMMKNIVVENSTYNTELHSTCFYHNTKRQRKIMIQDHDTKKEQAWSITLPQSDWFVLQNERS